MNVRCPVCGSGVRLAVGDTQLACTACGLAAPLSHIGTAPGIAPAAQLALETDLTGATLAGRQLVEKVGAGGMGTVYRAVDANGVAVAVKVLRPGLGAERAAMLARFAREAEAMRRLAHPRIVRFLDHGEEADAAYIVTELVEGTDLAARLAAGRLAFPEVLEMFGQVCDGVAAAHAAGIVHRDLKPANILVGADGVKVADFGLAQLGADVAVPTLTRTNVAMGTFHYLAPEQRKDARAVDHRADIWALGVILYEMLTGELPLGSFAAPSTLVPAGADRRVDAIVNRALAPDPAARYRTVAELAADIRKLAAPRRTQRLAIAGAAALALGLGSIVLLWSAPYERVAPPPATVLGPAPEAVIATDALLETLGVAAATPDAIDEPGIAGRGSAAERQRGVVDTATAPAASPGAGSAGAALVAAPTPSVSNPGVAATPSVTKPVPTTRISKVAKPESLSKRELEKRKDAAPAKGKVRPASGGTPSQQDPVSAILEPEPVGKPIE